MMGKHMDDERYRQIRKDVATIPTEKAYPCVKCKKHSIEDNCKCVKWQAWFSEAFSYVTGVLREGTR